MKTIFYNSKAMIKKHLRTLRERMMPLTKRPFLWPYSKRRVF